MEKKEMTLEELIAKVKEEVRVHKYHASFFEDGNAMKEACIKNAQHLEELVNLLEAIKRNSYDSNKGNLSAYARYIRYNANGMYNKKSKDIQKILKRLEDKQIICLK